MDCVVKLKQFINLEANFDDILNAHNPHISELYQQCYDAAFNTDITYDHAIYSYKIEYVLQYVHGYLHTGRWNDVDEEYRRIYTAVSFIKAALIVRNCSGVDGIRDGLKCIDHGFLLGLPLVGNEDLLHKTARYLGEYLPPVIFDEDSNAADDLEAAPTTKRPRINDVGMKSIIVDKLSSPSLELFYKTYFQPEQPVIIKDCMKHWPAMEKWKNLSYLIHTAGERTVPIELGASYSDASFSQKLMTLRQFIETYFNNNERGVGYLAQHDLLAQIPALKADVCIPEYCALNRQHDDDAGSSSSNEDGFEPEINAWFGPANTVSSLHHDPKDNLLCQVFGSKQVILFAPSDSEYLYVHEQPLLANTARVDPTRPDLNEYPHFSKAQMYSCRLNEGEMVYIPRGWWHHVTSLEKSFSINFWWR